MKVGDLVTPDTTHLKSGWFHLWDRFFEDGKVYAKQKAKLHVGELGIVISFKDSHSVYVMNSRGQIGYISIGNLKRIE